MAETFKHFEPFSEERALVAKEKAARIFNGKYNDYDEALLFLRFVISDYYGIPFFDPYFEDRSLDDLVFEAELIQLKKTPPEKRASNVVNQNRDEATSLFDDMAEEDDFVPVTAPQMDESAFDKIAKDFMESGDFKED